VRIWLVVLALAVAAAGVALFVLAREQPAQVTVIVHDAAPIAVAHEPDRPIVRHSDAAADAPPEHELETLRSSGPGAEPWVPQATTLLRGFDPAARVECYVAGCAATITFDSEDAYEHAVEVIRTDETWTGGKQWVSPERAGGKITAVLILYRPD
jgi:hypothetical protein